MAREGDQSLTVDERDGTSAEPRTGHARAEGTGAGGHKSNSGGSLKRSEMSASDKADYIRKHGQQAFLKLPK